MIWNRHYRLAGPKTSLKVQKSLIFFMRAEGARKILGVLRRGVPGGSRSNRDFRGGPGLGGFRVNGGGFRGYGEGGSGNFTLQTPIFEGKIDTFPL